jgi:protein translocase SecG subunit
MQTVILVIHLIVAVALIGTVMLQRSEGGALGMGGSNSGGGNLFSARGVGNALTRTTAILAACFFLTSISFTPPARVDPYSTALQPRSRVMHLLLRQRVEACYHNCQLHRQHRRFLFHSKCFTALNNNLKNTFFRLRIMLANG